MYDSTVDQENGDGKPTGMSCYEWAGDSVSLARFREGLSNSEYSCSVVLLRCSNSSGWQRA